MKNLTTTQKKVIQTLYDGDSASFGERLTNYKSLAGDTGFNHLQLKRAISGLRELGLVRHSPAVDEDGRPMGSGFMLTEKGDELADKSDDE